MAKKMWGGRFKKKTDPLVEKFSKSIQFDYKIAICDMLGSQIHTIILKENGYLTPQEESTILEALLSLSKEIEGVKFDLKIEEEDIHTYIQNRLQEKIGDLALKLHTGRSRNDQVVFATKLYCKGVILELSKDIDSLEDAINNLANENKDIIIPGFTHMQHAQPVMLSDYILTYSTMLGRDSKRLEYISKNMVVSMGAGALAGTPVNIVKYREKAEKYLKDHKSLKEALNLEVTTNSLDAVSDRDFIIEIISALSIIAMHLSRLAEDLIIWSTQEFDFVEIDESFCTGSSLMPQKKNPDALELIRGNTGRIYGNLVSVLTMMKGLPLTYNRDMQLDKEPLFNSFEIISMELKILEGLIKTLKFNKTKIEECLKDEALYATDLVYYLVDKGVAFKQAHTIVGELVKYSLDNDIEIKKLPEDKLKEFSQEFIKEEVVKLFDPLVSVTSKISIERK